MTFSKEFLVALYSLAGIGPASYRRVLTFLTINQLAEDSFWRNQNQIWQKIPLAQKTISSIKNFNNEYTPSSYLEHLRSQDIRVVFITDEEFPSLLKEIDNCPPMLFVKGAKLSPLDQYLAVVGSRKMTKYGQRVINHLIPPLIDRGKVIVSGFMYGVDVTAQQAALKNGGKTVGILGFGFDYMFPSNHQPLMKRFLKQGATFISPFAPQTPVIRSNFPRRNAIVAGMSQGVLVIEAAHRSGSHITAGFAAEFGRDVWAVPGSIFNDFSAGTARLINQGAQLVTTAEQIYTDPAFPE